MGTPRKPPDKRIRGGRTADIGVVTHRGDAPRMPRGLCPQAQNAWADYWADVVSGVMRPPDATVALRWVCNVDRYHRLITEADKKPMVLGSRGQPIANPIYKLVGKLEESIRGDERQLGVGAMNRLRLGLAVAESTKTLADLNGDTDTHMDDDPRTVLGIVVAAAPGAGQRSVNP